LKRTAYAIVLVLDIAGTMLAGCGGDENDEPKASPSPGPGEVTRQLLETAGTDRAPGQSLVLSRVVIPGGQSIAAHTHPGPQLAVIESGTLTYTVLKGQVQVTRKAGTSQSTGVTVMTGQSIDLEPGDSLIETPEMVHTARNARGEPVIIYLSSLFPEGAPPSIPVQ
jgi:quercetin dioxygenase-like cupin family protein